jgi:hypothetical protein
VQLELWGADAQEMSPLFYTSILGIDWDWYHLDILTNDGDKNNQSINQSNKQTSKGVAKEGWYVT